MINLTKIFFLILLIIFSSCLKQKPIKITKPSLNTHVDDRLVVIDTLYLKGDVRRYGVNPNKKINAKYLNNVMLLAKKGLPIIFPKGNYNTNLIFKGVNNVQITFNDAVISGLINIKNKDTIQSKNIRFNGKLIVLDKFFIKKSSHIFIENLSIISDTLKNINKHKNRGLSIYAGSKNIHFNKVLINNTGGSNNDYFKYTAAAFSVHGWNNNPENISINNLEINNASRTALYITGKKIKINKVKITNFGLGSNQNIFGLEDTKKGEEKEFTGFWMNRCNFCQIDSLIINSKMNNSKYSLQLDEGISSQPSFIFNISFKNDAKKMPIKDDELTNILVKNEF